MNGSIGIIVAWEWVASAAGSLAAFALVGWWLRRPRLRPSPDASAESRSQPPSSAAPLDSLDCSLLRYLSDGTPAGLAAQIDRYLDALTKAEARVQAARAAGRLAELGDAAHALLSQGRMVNHAGVIAAARKLEAAAFDARHDQIHGMTEALLQETNQLRASLTRTRPANPTT